MDCRRNLPLFIAFRVLFNARFYYPVIGILFLDLGLTLEQYAVANAVWAAAILLLEIPSGALADVIGRRTMVVAASVLMLLELLVFAFAPQGPMLFWFILLNRLLSGAAEACASGADEALAFDSLPAAEREKAWPLVLARLVRWSSAAFFVAMLAGAAAYDAAWINAAGKWFGFQWHFTAAQTARWPVYMTLASAVLVLPVALLMREPGGRTGTRRTVAAAWGGIRDATRFVFSTPRILILLATGVLFDSCVRMFLTLGSNYYRLIEIPVALNGVLGSTWAVIGFFAAAVARKAADTRTPLQIAVATALLIFAGLAGATAATPLWGVWILLPLGLAMPVVQFFLSNYLNLWTASDLRATVLSFRGMALNLAYGAAGLAYAAITSSLRSQSPGLDEQALFARTLPILPAAFIAGCLALPLAAQLLKAKRRG